MRAMGLNVIEVDTSEFVKSGGSVYCMKPVSVRLMTLHLCQAGYEAFLIKELGGVDGEIRAGLGARPRWFG